ncbi:spermatogenesis-associated protein 22-like [Centruroides vittatus]|uniref:spermatogenesis-associated protein 22-like n=1 Tax=Centruroides vittatus TaxID=120091 RepID=UPI00350EBFEC
MDKKTHSSFDPKKRLVSPYNLKRPSQPVFNEILSQANSDQSTSRLQLMPMPNNLYNFQPRKRTLPTSLQPKEQMNEKKYKFHSRNTLDQQPNISATCSKYYSPNFERNNNINIVNNSINKDSKKNENVILNKYPVWRKNSEASRENDLRIITVTPTTLHQWKLVQHHQVTLYELFGILDSPIETAKFATAKTFILRSGRDSIQILFYEIDRSLPCIRRGEWQRCIGSFDTVGNFRAVSIRQALDKEINNLEAVLSFMKNIMSNFVLLNEP